MAFFKLNIYGITDNVERHVNYSNKLKEQGNLVYNSLVGADSYWNDPNTISFISRIKRDGYNLSDYIIYLNDAYREVQNFNESIKNVCSKYGYKNTKAIKFNDTRKADCVRYLDQAIEILNNNLKRLQSLTHDVQYVSLSSVYEKISQIKKIIELINGLKSDISGFCGSINTCVSDSRYRKSKIEKKELGISLVEYGWNVTEGISQVNRTDSSNGLVANKNTISLTKRNDNLNTVSSMSGNSQQLGINKNDNVNLGYNSVNYGSPKTADIDYQSSKEGLQYSANYYAAPDSQNDVNISNRDYTLNTVNAMNANGQQIDVNKNGNINLGYNSVNYDSPKNADIDYQSSNEGLQYSVDSYNQPSNLSNANISDRDNTLNVPHAYDTRVNGGMNFNNYDNKVAVNSVNASGVSTTGMRFSNDMNNINFDAKVTSYNAPQVNSNMGNIGSEKVTINNVNSYNINDINN